MCHYLNMVCSFWGFPRCMGTAVAKYVYKGSIHSRLMSLMILDARLEIMISYGQLYDPFRKPLRFKSSSQNTSVAYSIQQISQKVFPRHQGYSVKACHCLSVKMCYFHSILSAAVGPDHLFSGLIIDVFGLWYSPLHCHVCRKPFDHVICYYMSEHKLSRNHAELRWAPSSETIRNQCMI